MLDQTGNDIDQDSDSEEDEKQEHQINSQNEWYRSIRSIFRRLRFTGGSTPPDTILVKNFTKTLSQLERVKLSFYLTDHEISDKQRCELWIRGSGAKTLMYDPSNINYYRNLQASVPDYPDPSFDLIVKDIDRLFNEENNKITDSARLSAHKILNAYVKRNPTVGYCQSMSFIAGILCKNLPEEDAFWVLCSIVECILPTDYFTQVITGYLVDQRLFDELLEIYMPEVKTHMKNRGFINFFYTNQWFL